MIVNPAMYGKGGAGLRTVIIKDSGFITGSKAYYIDGDGAFKEKDIKSSGITADILAGSMIIVQSSTGTETLDGATSVGSISKSMRAYRVDP